MPRRRFRWSADTGDLVEILDVAEAQSRHGIIGEIQPFISPVDGTLIKSRAHMQDYMARKGLDHYDPTRKRELDRYAEDRGTKAMRELMYENLTRIERTGRTLNDVYVGKPDRRKA